MKNLITGIKISTLAFLMCGSALSTQCYKPKEKEKITLEQQEEDNLRNNKIMIKLYQAKVTDDSLALVDALKAINGIDLTEKEKAYEKSKKRLKMLKEFNAENGKEQKISFPITKIESVSQYKNLENSQEYYFAETDSGAYACRNFDHAAIIEHGKIKEWLWTDNK